MARKLEDLERWFQAVVTHPSGVARGIDSDAAQRQVPVSSDSVDKVILPSSQLGSIERLEIYGNAYYSRLLECLRESFPTVVHAVGREAFDGFAFGYLQDYPSQSYTLSHLATHLIEYLKKTRPDSGSHQEEASFPDFLIDLVTLEWTIEQVFDGPGVEEMPLLSPGDLQAISPDAWPEAVLEIARCVRLLAFRYPVNDYFTAVRENRQPEAPLPAPSFLALTRRKYVVRRFELCSVQYELLLALSEGQTVGRAITRAAGRSEVDDDQLAANLRRWFQEWAEVGFFESVRFSK